ncbi:MAG TPA: betaine--homocysteine S-methyltransferase [Rhizobiales bacterium]|nr:betaine--homocysteine S-methyltransferase [Hyphomicrobiales bacterium]
MAKTTLAELLETRPWLLADGATGTNLFDMGLMSGDAPELWNLDPEQSHKIRTLHRKFVEAGSDIILTNSFGGGAYRLKLHNLQDQVFEINKAAAELARMEADAVDRPVLVAGSVGPTGEIFQPVGELAYEDGVTAFAEQARGLKAGGADVLWIETMSAEDEYRAAVEGCATTGLPIVGTMSFDTNGRTMMGITPENFALFTADVPNGPVAVGANCGTGASELLATVLGILKARPDAIVVAKGNCGIPEYKEGAIHYSGTPELMADYARLALDAGARIIGGCCGTSYDHLAAMRAALESHEKQAVPTIEQVIEKLGEVSEMAKSGGCGHDHGHGKPARAGRRRRRAS